jgi:hypothetical protein
MLFGNVPYFLAGQLTVELFVRSATNTSLMVDQTALVSKQEGWCACSAIFGPFS